MRTGVCPFGVGAAQMWPQVGALFNAIDEFNIDLVVELGVYMGGLSELLYLRQIRTSGFRYIGFDNAPAQVNKRLLNELPFVWGDVFSEEIKNRVVSEISHSAHALVYCDDGNKPREMRTYAPLVRQGDLILVHDYPGEATPASLEEFGKIFPFMQEIEPEAYRGIGISLWRRV
jgi:cephalosporin hydroxylase